MKLVAGLGNPGKKYEKTRHNIGFRIIDAMQNEPGFAEDKTIVFLRPQTFMNNSGKEVKKMLKYYHLRTDRLIVIHDDIDLPFGTIKVSNDSHSAGHKGVQSIIDELKTQQFIRVRIGIFPKPKTQNPKPKIDTTKFVLKNFSKPEEKELEGITKRACEIIAALLSSCS